MKKKCGVLLPVFSLPSKYGIGTLGKWAYKFIDFLKKAGHSYWQILPLVQTGYGDSPYSTVCDKSGNPFFIDPEILRDKRLLTYREVETMINKSDFIDYDKLYKNNYPMYRKAFSRFDKSDKAFKSFVKNAGFNDYALFMTMSEKFQAPWYEWEDKYKYRDSESLIQFAEENENELLFWQFLQYEFDCQYKQLKKYANSKGIKIIGDLPLYLSRDSVEVWTNPKNFLFGDGYKPNVVAGVPPDYFSKDGQLWGNPVYNYDYMEADGFSFWKERVNNALNLYDLVRIDHFRGLDRFWAVPYGSETAKNGYWVKAKGRELLASIDSTKLFAEDLGMIDDGVRKLIEDTKLPKMKVLEFAFDSDDNNTYLPWNTEENSVIYTGTHDNDTLIGFLKSLDKKAMNSQKLMIKKSLDYLKIYKSATGVYSTADAIIDIAYASKSFLTIIPMQDILHLGTEYRINKPGVVGCWKVRLKESMFTDNLANLMQRRANRFSRF